MHDVLVLSLSIFFIKSQGVYDAKSLNGVYFFTAAVMFMILAYAWLGSDVTAAEKLNAPAKPVQPSSTLRNFAFSFLIILATVFFALGVMLPAIRFTTVFVWTNQHSIATIIWALYKNEEFFLCFVIFMFSIFFPFLKLFYLLTLVTSPDMPSRVPRQVDLGHGMAWTLFDDRRDGAGLDDLLHKRVGLHGSVRAARRLLLRGLDPDDHVRLRLGEFDQSGHRASPGQPAGAPRQHRPANGRESPTSVPFEPLPTSHLRFSTSRGNHIATLLWVHGLRRAQNALRLGCRCPAGKDALMSLRRSRCFAPLLAASLSALLSACANSSGDAPGRVSERSRTAAAKPSTAGAANETQGQPAKPATRAELPKVAAPPKTAAAAAARPEPPKAVARLPRQPARNLRNRLRARSRQRPQPRPQKRPRAPKAKTAWRS